MISRLGDVYAQLLGRPSLARLHRALFYLSARALGLHNYRSPQLSGEDWLVRRAARLADAPVVVDVGANVGEWSAAVRLHAPHAVIHAFEPQRVLVPQIEARVPGAAVTCAAVGDEPGELELHDYAEHSGSQHASLVAGIIENVHGGRSRKVLVPVVTLDAYCEARGIERIDLLKVDVEGFELRVLQGARRLLDEGRVGAIQFEITSANVLGRLFFDDFARCLGEGFALYRLLPHGLMRLRRGHHWFNEQFDYQNIVALRRGLGQAWDRGSPLQPHLPGTATP